MWVLHPRTPRPPSRRCAHCWRRSEPFSGFFAEATAVPRGGRGLVDFIGMQLARGEALAARRARAARDAARFGPGRRGHRRSLVFQQGSLRGRPFVRRWRMRMQLKRPSRVGDVRLRLMAASCALLGAGAGRAQQASPAPADSRLLEDWTVDSALAYYHEDGRIQAIEPVVDATKLFADGQQVALNVTFDSL